jgi:ABC-2 type transport system permease protein
MKGILQENMISLEESIHSQYVYKNKGFNIQPTSVQQSVPAWLVFSMFFILIPISNTFIQEKNLGTLNRIKSINISLFPLIFGKIVPYYIINQIQVVLMILVGMYIVPKLGGDSLVIEGNIPLIFIISSAISFAAISFAIFISNISKSTEEATSIGGLSNIILAALGGVMVPKVVMPLFMQDITNYSPMAWGLESFLEVFVLGGDFGDIQSNLIKLVMMGFVFLLISYILLKRKVDR